VPLRDQVKDRGEAILAGYDVAAMNLVDSRSPAGAPLPMLRMRGVRKVYRPGLIETGSPAGLSLTVERGEFLVVMGPAGSGKTSFLSVAGPGPHRAHAPPARLSLHPRQDGGIAVKCWLPHGAPAAAS
jgi:hypothetical protein